MYGRSTTHHVRGSQNNGSQSEKWGNPEVCDNQLHAAHYQRLGYRIRQHSESAVIAIKEGPEESPAYCHHAQIGCELLVCVSYVLV